MPFFSALTNAALPMCDFLTMHDFFFERTPEGKRSRAEAELDSNADANDDDDDNGDWQQKYAIVIRRAGIKMTPTVRVSGQEASLYFLSMNHPSRLRLEAQSSDSLLRRTPNMTSSF